MNRSPVSVRVLTRSVVKRGRSEDEEDKEKTSKGRIQKKQPSLGKVSDSLGTN